jgi:hypothetical protein
MPSRRGFKKAREVELGCMSIVSPVGKSPGGAGEIIDVRGANYLYYGASLEIARANK